MTVRPSVRASSRVLVALGLLTLAGALLVGAPTADAKKGRGKAPAASADCKTDADCVAVDDDCCSCNEGGKRRAIPKKQRAAYEKELRKRCQGTMCTEVMSQDATCSQRATCNAGICELGDAPADSAP
jgi:hypothetical protein